MKVGIIGAGGIAPAHIAGWQELGAEVSILSRGGAAALAARYGIEVVASLDELLERAEVVDIISPTSTHAEIALAAIRRGIHVVCEKPLATSAAEASTMAQAASDAGVHLFPAHVVRYFGDYARAKQQADAGAVGELLELRFERTVAAPSSEWFFDADAGGGLIRDLMIHDLDQAVWFAGPVDEVSATQSAPAGAGRAAAPVSAEVELIHTSGAVSRVRAEWAAADTGFRSTAEIIGTRGVLQIDTAASDATEPGHPSPASDPDPYLLQLADFVEMLETGSEARVCAADGVMAVALVDAAYASLAAGQPIALEF